MASHLSSAELEAYLDESLSAAMMSEVEDALRHDAELAGRLAAIIGRRDAGVHSLGEIWRRGRLSCPSREQLGSYLLEALPDDLAAYVAFHINTVDCRYCEANLTDLKTQQADAQGDALGRRRRYFQSSAGYLKQR